MPDSLLTGMSALTAQQRAMEVTSHNLANATTPGYSRQRVDLQAARPENSHPGQFGTGVDIGAVRRMVDDLVDNRLRNAEGEAGRLANLKQNLLVVQQAFNEPGENGLSALIGRVFASFDDLASNPESVAIRATVTQELETFTATTADLGKRLQSVRDDLGSSLSTDLTKVNDLTSSIVTLNQQIRIQVNIGNKPNDLLDRRQQQLNELTSYIDIKVRVNPQDQSVQVDLGGRLLVSNDRAEVLSAKSTDNGDLTIVGAAGIGYEVTGGKIGATYDLHKAIVPGVIAQMDELSATIAHEMNARHATGVSNSYRANAFVGEYTVPPTQTGMDLDSLTLIPSAAGQPGIPKAFLPDFTDGKGTLTSRNLTINVLNTATGVAQKYTLKWNPAVNGGSRSLDDLVSAINTGTGGGFTVFPPNSNGVAGLNAQKTQVDGGYRLQLSTVGTSTSVDFSPALDLKPAASAWTGTGTVAINGTIAPAIASNRLSLTVNASGTALDLSYRNPASGATVALGSAPIPLVGTSATVINGISVSVNAGSYRAGDRLGLALDASGAVVNSATGIAGTENVVSTWNAGDAGMTVSGRYTNTLSDPTHPWSMKVITPGIIGNRPTLAAPNNPPVVQFTYWTGSDAAPVQQVVTKTLDDTLPAGTPITLSDGVYVAFSAGSLTTANRQVSFTVDGQPDQAELLPALGINGLFSGGEAAATLSVATRIAKDPSQLGLARTRSEGDNSNIVALSDVRKLKLFSANSFTLDDFYHGLLTTVGVQIQQTTRLAENQDSLKASLNNQREQLSGVNIDEEVGRLIQQQQAYSAAAKVVSAARDNIQTLLEILR
jgi:flagellar hook-associated protein FlgK